jgi:WD40 repeat protein
MSDPSDSSSSSPSGRVAALADSFLERYRKGERPALAEYTERYPELAEEILLVFPALVEMEQLGPLPGAGEVTGSFAGSEPAEGPAIRRIGDYRILREIGRGGMGVVYEAEQESLGRHVALKMLPGYARQDLKLRERFRREARAAANLHHTNIVPVFGVGEHEGTPYYVMQFIQGQALDEVLGELRQLRGAKPESAAAAPVEPQPGLASGAEGRPSSAAAVAQALLTGHFTVAQPPSSSAAFPGPGGWGATAPALATTQDAPAPAPTDELAAPSPLAELSPAPASRPGRVETSSLSGSTRDYWRGVARIGIQAAEALHHAHTQGTLHRDIKPSNLLLDLHGTVWITDFGLAKAADEADLTRTGDILGTLRYMAPERFRGVSGPGSDVYGLGMTLYELLTLGPAFAETDRERLIHQITQSEPARPSRVNPEVPRDLETIVLKAIDREPAHRYQSAGELAEDLQRYLEDRPIRARRASVGERVWRWCRRNPVVAGLTAVAMSLLLAVVTVSLAGYIQTSAALGREAQARREAEGHLYHSLIGEARALRIARVDGYRQQVWDRLGRAMRLTTLDRDVSTLRREAAACLGDFVGLEPTVIEGFPATILSLALHSRAEQVAIGLTNGDVHVRRLVDGGPIAVLHSSDSVMLGLEYGPEGHSVTIFRADGSIEFWSPDPNRGWVCSGTFKVGEGITPDLVARAPRRFVFVQRDKGLMLQNLADGTMIRLETHDIDAFRWQFPSPTPIMGRYELGPRSDCRFAALSYSREIPKEGTSWGFVVWDVRTGRELQRLVSPIGPAFRIIFSPNSDLMALGGQGLAVYELPSFRQRSLIRWDTVQEHGFSPDGQYLAAATLTGQVNIWSTTTNREVATLMHYGDGNAHSLAISDDGQALARSGIRKVRTWHLARTAERKALAGHGGGVTTVAFSPDGARLASTGTDGTVRIWDPATGRLCRTLSGFSNVIQTAAFSPDGRILATGEETGRIRLWDTRTWAELDAPGEDNMGEIACLTFSPHGEYLAAGSGEGGMAVWRLRRDGRDGADQAQPTFERLARVPGPLSVCVAFSPDGELVAFVDRFIQGVRLWDVANRREVPFHGPRLLSGYRNLSFRPGGRQLAFVTSRGVAEVWDTTAGTRVLSLGDDGAFANHISTISPSGRWFAGESTPAGVALWDLERRELVFSLREERSPVWSQAWSPDERWLAIGLSDGGLCVWDLHEVQSQLNKLGLGWR